jgi:UDP-2,3-diacylglucosamine pyrophosphatase LpxH
LTETPKETNTADMLIGHLIDGKKKHDERKNVENEEIEHLNKGADYLTTLLLQHGIKPAKGKSIKQKPPNVDELKKQFVKNLVDNGYVTIDHSGRTVIAEKGQKFLEQKTKKAEDKVTLAKLINLRYRKSLTRKNKKQRKINKKTKSKGVRSIGRKVRKAGRKVKANASKVKKRIKRKRR